MSGLLRLLAAWRARRVRAAEPFAAHLARALDDDALALRVSALERTLAPAGRPLRPR